MPAAVGDRRTVFGRARPYLQLVLGVVLVTSAEVILKLGSAGGVGASAAEGAPTTDSHIWLHLGVLATPWTWGGIVCYVTSLVNWLSVLRRLKLIVAYNLMNAVHVAVPLASWVLLGETIGGQRWAGIMLVVAGLVLLASSAAKAEDTL